MVALLEVDNLGVRFTRKDAPPVDAVSGVSFSLEAGKTLGIVGESSRANQTVMAMLGLLAGNARPPAPRAIAATTSSRWIHAR